MKEKAKSDKQRIYQLERTIKEMDERLDALEAAAKATADLAELLTGGKPRKGVRRGR